MKLDPLRTASKIDMVPIGTLRPFDKNPKLHPDEQIDSICRSIKTFGWTVPILIHDRFGIVAGHGRYVAAQKLKLEEVPVIRLDYLSPDEAKAYLLRDNKEAETGYNEDLLATILVELENAHVDLEITGFSDDEITKLLNPEIPLPEDGHGKTREVSENEKESDIIASFGEYRFPVDREIYLQCIEEIKQKYGFEKEAVISEIKRRLKL